MGAWAPIHVRAEPMPWECLRVAIRRRQCLGISRDAVGIRAVKLDCLCAIACVCVRLRVCLSHSRAHTRTLLPPPPPAPSPSLALSPSLARSPRLAMYLCDSPRAYLSCARITSHCVALHSAGDRGAAQAEQALDRAGQPRALAREELLVQVQRAEAHVPEGRVRKPDARSHRVFRRRCGCFVLGT